MSPHVWNTEQLPPLGKSDTVGHALQLMDDFKLAHYPVVDDQGVYLGLLRESDLLEIEDPTNPLESLVYTGFRPYIQEHHSIFKRLKVFTDHRLTVLPIVDDKQVMIAVMLISDVIEFFRETPTLMQPGAIVELAVEGQQYSLVEMAGIVEQNEAKVLGLWITGATDDGKLIVLLKLNRTFVQPVVQSFERYGYTILAVFGDEQNVEDLKYRYDLLMKYLNP